MRVFLVEFQALWVRLGSQNQWRASYGVRSYEQFPNFQPPFTSEPRVLSKVWVIFHSCLCVRRLTWREEQCAWVIGWWAGCMGMTDSAPAGSSLSPSHFYYKLQMTSGKEKNVFRRVLCSQSTKSRFPKMRVRKWKENHLRMLLLSESL